MKKIIAILALVTPMLSTLPKSEEVTTCEGIRVGSFCSNNISSVTSESSKSTFCNKGLLKVFINKIRAFGITSNEKIVFTATNNQTNKSYTSVLQGPTAVNTDPIIGIISGLPAGTYTVTTTDIINNFSDCIYKCSNIHIKASNCYLMASCCK